MQDSTELKLISSHPEVGNIKTFIFETGGLGWTAGQYNTYILPQAGDTEELNHTKILYHTFISMYEATSRFFLVYFVNSGDKLGAICSAPLEGCYSEGALFFRYSATTSLLGTIPLAPLVQFAGQTSPYFL